MRRVTDPKHRDMADFKEYEYGRMASSWLRSHDWEAYKEVGAPGKSGRVVDIYAIKGDPKSPRRTLAVEVKTALTLRVMEQAEYWNRYSDKTIIAVPEAASSRSRSFAAKVCQEFGIGILLVPEDEDGPQAAYLDVSPKRTGRLETPNLHPKMKDRTAGDSGGKRTAAFLETQEQLREVAHELPGIALADAIKRIDHHYTSVGSAFSSLRGADLDGLALRRKDNGQLQLYTTRHPEA